MCPISFNGIGFSLFHQFYHKKVRRECSDNVVMTTIGNFLVCDKLGEGSFGVVYSGQCVNSKRDVAIKLEKEPDAPTSLIRHEAKVLLSLKGCKGVPPLLGYGVFEGHRYVVLPLFSESLQERVERDGKLQGLVGLVIRNQIRDILKEIHRRGFIHRDIKPDNVMFDGDNLFLIDFGCATNYKVTASRANRDGISPHNRTPPKTKSYVGTYEFLGELGRQGYVCKEVDYEALDKTMDACTM